MTPNDKALQLKIDKDRKKIQRQKQTPEERDISNTARRMKRKRIREVETCLEHIKEELQKREEKQQKREDIKNGKLDKDEVWMYNFLLSELKGLSLISCNQVKRWNPKSRCCFQKYGCSDCQNFCQHCQTYYLSRGNRKWVHTGWCKYCSKSTFVHRCVVY
jgi:hypothetical protein